MWNGIVAPFRSVSGDFRGADYRTTFEVVRPTKTILSSVYNFKKSRCVGVDTSRVYPGHRDIITVTPGPTLPYPPLTPCRTPVGAKSKRLGRTPLRTFRADVYNFFCFSTHKGWFRSPRNYYRAPKFIIIAVRTEFNISRQADNNNPSRA